MDVAALKAAANAAYASGDATAALALYTRALAQLEEREGLPEAADAGTLAGDLRCNAAAARMQLRVRPAPLLSAWCLFRRLVARSRALAPAPAPPGLCRRAGGRAGGRGALPRLLRAVGQAGQGVGARRRSARCTP
jgi:hypothetical protein